MSEFTPTHRVTSNKRSIACHGFGIGETVARLHKWDDSEYVYSNSRGESYHLLDDEVEPISQEDSVTELIPRKRYRWTVEGVAVDESATKFGLSIGDARLIHGSLVLSAGKLEPIPDPLPTTPESVIRWIDNADNPHKAISRTAVRTNHETWLDQYGVGWTDEELSGANSTVRFDAGAE